MTPEAVAIWGQAGVALTFALLGVQSWRGSRAAAFGPALIVGMLATSSAALAAALLTASPVAMAFGSLRDLALAWLLWVVHEQARSGRISLWRRDDPLLWLGIALLAGAIVLGIASSISPTPLAIGLARVASLGAVVLGLVLVENVYASARLDGRWAVKHLLLGLGIVFAYDLFMHTEALLLHRLSDPIVWAQPFVLLLAAPLIGIGAARLRGLTIEVPIARDFVVRSTAMIACGLYFVMVALSAWLLNLVGLEWGPTFQILLFAGAAVNLLVLVGSGEMRARTRRAIERAFYTARYDYRTAWLRFVATVEGVQDGLPLRARLIKAVADPLDCTAGLLLLRGTDGRLHPAAQRNWAAARDAAAATSGWPVDTAAALAPVVEAGATVTDPRSRAEALPEWLQRQGDAWIVLGLRHQERLLGVLVLGKARLHRRLTPEDRDLLQLLGSHCALLLAEDLSTRALTEAQKFDRISRHFSFVAHDLKNIISQLALIVGEAKRLRDNREFIEDALVTVAAAVEKMRGILLRLRDEPETARTEPIDIASLVGDLVGRRGRGALGAVEQRPMPAGLVACADRAGLAAVLENLVGNAQEATGGRGRVEVAADRCATGIVLEVADDGPGMSSGFVADHLFAPFASTKDTGFGLGMYQCRTLVERWGGRLEIDSAPGQGTRVRVILPTEPILEPA